jgi:hypothetical protein
MSEMELFCETCDAETAHTYTHDGDFVCAHGDPLVRLLLNLGPKPHWNAGYLREHRDELLRALGGGSDKPIRDFRWVPGTSAW